MEPEMIAAQLRCPHGPESMEVAGRMNTANGSVNYLCIEYLQIRPNQRILEIGPGNGAFISEIVNRADDVFYTGLDWSEDMVKQAREINATWVEKGIVRLEQGSSDSIPFAEKAFDRILTVHTCYFWENPGDHFAEIRRVLKDDGRLCIAFGDRSFMQDLPFVSYGFKLYDRNMVMDLLAAAGFRCRYVYEHKERGLGNAGDNIKKTIHLIVAEPE